MDALNQVLHRVPKKMPPVPDDVRAAYGEYRPTVLVFKRRMAIIYRSPKGYRYQMFSTDSGASLGTSSPYPKHEAAIVAAERTLEGFNA